VVGVPASVGGRGVGRYQVRTSELAATALNSSPLSPCGRAAGGEGDGAPPSPPGPLSHKGRGGENQNGISLSSSFPVSAAPSSWYAKNRSNPSPWRALTPPPPPSPAPPHPPNTHPHPPPPAPRRPSSTPP